MSTRCQFCRESAHSHPFVFAANASGAGSWRVVGNSGCIAVHALPFTNELLLLMARPNNEEGGQDTALTNYLTVRTRSLLSS